MTTLSESLNPADAALLVIDMQVDLCDPAGFYGSLGKPVAALGELGSGIARLIDSAHAVHMPVIFTQQLFDPRLPDLIGRHKAKPDTVGSIKGLVPGSGGALNLPILTPTARDFLVTKPDYSAFYESDMESLLRRLNIHTLVITGVLAHACVLHTVFDAFVRDIDVLLVSDLVASWMPDVTAAALTIIGQLLGPLVTAEEANSFIKRRQHN